MFRGGCESFEVIGERAVLSRRELFVIFRFREF